MFMFVFIIACGGGAGGGSMLCMSYHLLIRTTLLWDGLFSHYRARCSYNIMHKNLFISHIFVFRSFCSKIHNWCYLLKLGCRHPHAMHWMIMDFKVTGDFYLLFYLMSPSLQMCNSDLVWSQIERICQLFHITFILTLFQNWKYKMRG